MDHLFGTLPTISNDNRVGENEKCPDCLERNADLLVWQDDDVTIECQTCGARYELCA
jgi:Zn ribbon nucleic-acid-binding protein